MKVFKSALKIIGFTSILLTVASSSARAAPLKVMTFNVMCDFCGTHEENSRFREKLAGVADTIRRHHPDLISLQEIWSGSDIRSLEKQLGDEYSGIYANGLLLGYADPTLFVRKARFKVLDRDGIWLGPKAPGFSLGWATSFPRRLEWVELVDELDQKKFIFAGTHFDNRSVNKDPSVDLVIEKLRQVSLPVIFAGDTNLKPSYPGYEKMRSAFRDTFFEVKEHPYFSNASVTNADGCNVTKAPSFPECRVDHVLLSNGAPWKVTKWGVDTYRYFGNQAFLSDHRAVIVELESVSSIPIPK